MKSVYLDYRGREWTITDEGFEKITQIIRESWICETCKLGYTDEHPQVAQNCCLACFLVRESRHGITFLDESGGNYRFIDPRGEIRLTDINSTESRVSVTETIRYHSFPVPQSIQVDGVAKILSEWHWHIYGNVERSCIILQYGSSSNGEAFLFLAYKNGSYVELNKRKRAHRELLQRARNQIEASRDKEGYYNIGGNRFYGMYESSIFEVASQIASIEFDVLHQVME